MISMARRGHWVNRIRNKFLILAPLYSVYRSAKISPSWQSRKGKWCRFYLHVVIKCYWHSCIRGLIGMLDTIKGTRAPHFNPRPRSNSRRSLTWLHPQAPVSFISQQHRFYLFFWFVPQTALIFSPPYRLLDVLNMETERSGSAKLIPANDSLRFSAPD